MERAREAPLRSIRMSTIKQRWGLRVYEGFYWIGIAMTLLCFGLILAGNTELAWRYEHRSLPVSWQVAAGAVLAFLTAEFCHVAFSRDDMKNEQGSQLSIDWEPGDWEAAETVEL